MNQIEFTKAIFNNLDGYIEIREIGEKSKPKQIFFQSIEELQGYKAPEDINIYFGVYTRSEKQGKAASCKTTGTLWADFDNIALDEALNRIKHAGLPKPSIIVNSGHGIHTYWLLSKRTGNNAVGLLKAISNITGADPRTAEKARVMRLPGTMNVKDEPVKCEVIEFNKKRYDIKEFTKVLNIEVAVDKLSEPIKTIPEALKNSHMACVKNMAAGVEEGKRNFALGRITKYLQMKGYTKEQSRKIVLEWNNGNKPPEGIEKLLREFEAYWKGDYKLLGCKIDNPELQSLLSDYCDRSECKLQNMIINLKLNNIVKYNNRIFNAIDRLTGNDLIVYGILLRHSEGMSTSQLMKKLYSKASGKHCIERTTLLSETVTSKHPTGIIKKLKGLGFIQVLEGNKRAGKENFYKAIPQGTYGLGYTITTNGAINGAIDGRITSEQFKLYVLLLKYAFQKGNCYPSLTTLGKDLGIDYSVVSKQLKALEESDYIKRSYTCFKGNQKLVFTLLV